MPATVFGPQATVLSVYQLLNGRAPANATFLNQVGFATQFGEAAYATALTQSLQGQTNAQVAATVVKNAGITNQGVVDYVAAVLGSFGPSARGQVIINLANKLAGFEGDVNFGTAAASFNSTISSNLSYSTNTSNTTDSAVGSNNGNEAGSNLVLTTGQDIVTGTAGADFFRAVAGTPINGQDQTTLNSSDILDGGAGQDTLVVNLNGNYGGGARIKSIETLQIGSNVQGNVTFDYNVNQGQNEVSDVTKIVADQINTGESLTIANLLKTSVAASGTTAASNNLPTLAWVNDSTSRDAGTVVANYRGAQVVGTGTTVNGGTTGDTQAVQLQSDEKGVLNIGAGIETITIESLGTERVTLNNASAAFQETATGFTNVADVVSQGSLTRVQLSGTAEIGKLAGVAATTGLTDRAAGSDFGITTTGATPGNIGNGTGSNLLSVDARVTEVDATNATAAVNVRFVGKSDFSATDVTFKGGAGNDYAEFELGNVSATGGAGADTFAFITTAAGVTNSTFGAGDTLVGGAGSDTIQLGLNGVGTFNVAQSEFANKTGFETLDLRGAINNVTLTGAFVAAADAGTTFTVRTDKIVQTSLTNSANATGSSIVEDQSVSTIDLSNINAGQALNFIGGSGSDRIIFTDATATGSLNLDGGTNVANTAGAVAGFGDYDTLTLVNGGILDRADLANVRNFEGLVLVKNTTGNNNFRVELTSAFLLANTQATNATETSIDDTVFRIASVAGANGTALAAGDVVTIDISDLLNGTRTALATSLAGRGLDVSVGAAQVNYVVDGAAATATQIGLVTKADAARADLAGSVANPTPVVFAFTGTAVTDNYTLATNADNVQTLAGNDVITLSATTTAPTGTLDGGAGTDALTLTATVNNLSAANLISLETLNVATVTASATVGGGTNTSLTVAELNGFTTINAATVVAAAAGGNLATTGDTFTITSSGAFTTANAAAVEVFNLSSSGNTVTFSNNATQTFNGTGTGTDSITTTSANLANKTLVLGQGSDTLTVTDQLAAGFGAANNGIDIYNFQGGVAAAATVVGSDGAGVVYNVGGASAAGAVITLGTGGQVVNSTTTGAIRYNGSAAGVDTYNLGAGAEAVGNASNITAIDVVNGFKAAGADTFASGVVATSLNVLNIATADSTTLAAAIQTAAAGITGAALASNGQAYIVNVAAGTAAGQYAFQNTSVTGAAATTVDAGDFLVKLIGTVGTIVAADFTA